MEVKKVNHVRPSGTVEKLEQKQSQSQKTAEEFKRVYLAKLLILLALAGFLITFTTIAWFTMNRETGTSGMGVKAQSTPYTIQTRDSSGYYSTVYESLGTEGMEWKISSGKNFDNHESAKKEGETEPGIEPGDHGILEYRVNPNSADSITVDCVFDMMAYAETTTIDGEGATVTEVTPVSNPALLGYVKAHIMLFSGIDSNGKYTGLIDTDETMRRVLADQTYTKNSTTYTQIYWVWPMYLSDLTGSDPIFAASERSSVIAYIASNKDGFFKDCSDNAAKVSTDLTALSVTYSSAIFNHYSMKYDNADLEIGNNVTYVMLSMQVE